MQMYYKKDEKKEEKDTLKKMPTKFRLLSLSHSFLLQSIANFKKRQEIC